MFLKTCLILLLATPPAFGFNLRGCSSSEAQGIFKFRFGTWQLDPIKQKLPDSVFIPELLKLNHWVILGSNGQMAFGAESSTSRTSKNFGTYNVQGDGVLTINHPKETFQSLISCMDETWVIDGTEVAHPGDIAIQVRFENKPTFMNVYSKSAEELPAEYNVFVGGPSLPDLIQKTAETLDRTPTQLIFEEQKGWIQTDEKKSPNFFSREWNDLKRHAIISVSRTVLPNPIGAKDYTTIFTNELKGKACEIGPIVAADKPAFKSEKAVRARQFFSYQCKNIPRFAVGVIMAGNAFEIYSSLIEFKTEADLKKQKDWAQQFTQQQIGVCSEENADACRNSIHPALAEKP